MRELFETIFTLSLFGFAITAVLLILKPVTSKKFPARWQYYVWIAVLISMLVPTYKLIPQKEAESLSFIVQTDTWRETIPQLKQEIFSNVAPKGVDWQRVKIDDYVMSE